MSAELDRIMAKLAAEGVTVNVTLADPNRDTTARRIGESAKRVGNYWCKTHDAGAEGCTCPEVSA